MYNRVSSNRSDQLKSTLLNNSIVFTLHTKSTPLGPSKKMHHSSTPAIQNQKKAKTKAHLHSQKRKKNQSLTNSYHYQATNQNILSNEANPKKRDWKRNKPNIIQCQIQAILCLGRKQARDSVQRLCPFCTKVLTDGSCLALWSINMSFPVVSAILT